jgi:hypothetical protein
MRLQQGVWVGFVLGALGGLAAFFESIARLPGEFCEQTATGGRNSW